MQKIINITSQKNVLIFIRSLNRSLRYKKNNIDTAHIKYEKRFKDHMKCNLKLLIGAEDNHHGQQKNGKTFKKRLHPKWTSLKIPGETKFTNL